MGETALVILLGAHAARFEPEIRARGFETARAASPRDADSFASRVTDAALLVDASALHLDALHACIAARRARPDHALVVLLEFPDDALEIALLDRGARDVLRPPLSPVLVAARVEHALRMTPRAPPRSGALAIDESTRTALVGKRRVALTGRQLVLLRLLIGRAGEPVTRAEIFAAWQMPRHENPNLLRKHVGALREKLGPEHGARVVPVASGGYRLNGEKSAPPPAGLASTRPRGVAPIQRRA